MINITPSAQAQTIVIPRNISEPTIGSLTLTLTGTASKKNYYVSVTPVSAATFNGVVNFMVTGIINVPVGEYQYVLSDEAEILAVGLLQAGRPTRQAETYDEQVTYKQYNG